ncbi:uracil-DNA glycosylase [Noviherbaspirillum sedimenti]
MDPRRARFLQEIGVGPLWRLRERQPADLAPATAAAAVAAPVSLPVAAEIAAQVAAPFADAAAARPTPAFAAVVPATAAIPTAPAAPSSRSDSPAAWDEAVPDWVLEDAPDVLSASPADEGIDRMDWESLQSTVAACTKCRLCEGRTRTVFGSGDRQAKWLFVGEGPGYNEDLQGEPFVGPAGKLLDNMLAAMGLRRGDNAYIANAVKCRPTGENGRDRPPTPAEIAACLPHLERQIALIQPSVIVALGKSAALALLQAAADTPVAKLRGQVHRHAGVPLVVTYHPAYLLRAPEEKGKAWRDLCLAMATHADTASTR